MATKIKIEKRFIHGRVKRRGFSPGGGGVAPIAPTAIAGLRISVEPEALGALADNDPIATWTDGSGLGNSFTAAAGQEPLNKTNILNGFPVARFDAVDNFMSSAYSPGDSSDPEVTFCAVFRTNTIGTGEQMILWAGEAAANGWGAESEMHTSVNVIPIDNVVSAAMGGAAAGDGSLLPFTDTSQFHVLMGIYRNMTSATKTIQVFLDGTFGTPAVITAANNYAAYQATMQMGRPGAATRFFNGDIAAVAVFARALSFAETLGLHQFWRNKFAL